MPTFSGRRLAEPVGGHCRRPVWRVAGGRLRVRDAAGDQSGGGGKFEDQSQSGLVDAGDLGQPPNLTHPESTTAQLGNGSRAECFEQDVEFAQQVDDRAGGRGVGIGGRGGGHHRIRRRQPHRSGSLAAHYLPDVARQDHRVGVDSPQQPDRNQLRHGAIRGSTGCRVAGASQRRALQQPVQQLALRLVETVDQFGDLLRALRGVFERHLPDVPGQAAAGLGRHLHVQVAPGQRPLFEVVERAEHLGLGGAVTDQREQLGDRHRRGIGLQHKQRVDHRKPQKVQLVGGSLQRLASLRAGGQRGDAARRRLGKVGPKFQQTDQPVVGQFGQPGPQRDARGVFCHC